MVHPPSPPASATTLRLHRARVKLSTRAQAHGKPHHTHCYTNGKIQRRVRVYRPSARDAYTRPANPGPRTVANGHAEFAIQRSSPHSPFFCTALDDDERTSVGRVSHCFLSSVCQNFLKCIRTKNRVIFLSQRRNFEVSKNLSFERMKILSRSRSWPRFTNRL